MEEELSSLAAPISYVVLRPPLDECLRRVVSRSVEPEHGGALSDGDVVRRLFTQFEALGSFERHVLSEGVESAEDAAEILVNEIRHPGKYLLTW
jgi:hypothetical protein